MSKKHNHTMMKSLTLALALCAASTSLAKPSVVLKGVDPAHYMQKRNHKPDVSVELKALPPSVSLDVLKDPAAFLVEAGQTKAARDVELRALQQGALTALAQHAQQKQATAADVDAIAAAMHGVYLESHDNVVRAVAVERLGALPGDEVAQWLQDIVDDADEDVDVRAAAAAGFGRRGNSAEAAFQAWAALRRVVVDEQKREPEALRVAALHATAHLASRWAWQAKGDVASGERLRQEAVVVVAAVDGSAALVAARDEALRLLK